MCSYCQNYSCKISGIVMSIPNGDAYLIKPFSNDTLATAKIQSCSFELNIEESKKYTGLCILSFIRDDKKFNAKAMVFAESAHIYFFLDKDNTTWFAGTENQLKVNKMIHAISDMEKENSISTQNQADSLRTKVTKIFNDFIETSKKTALQDFSLLLAADLLVKDKINYLGLTEAEYICKDKNTPASTLFCQCYEEAKKTLIGTKIPKLKLMDINDQYIEFNQQRDSSKYLIIDFWASWCGPCLKKFTELESYFAQNKDKIQVLTISGDKSVDKWKAKVEQLYLPYINLYDGDKSVHKLFKANAIPHLIVVDKNDIIIAINPQDIKSIIK